jgi:flagellar protein FlaI
MLGKACTGEIVSSEGLDILKVNCQGCPYGCSLEESSDCMLKTMEKLLTNRRVDKIQLESKMVKEYDPKTTKFLKEIAEVIAKIKNDSKLFSVYAMGPKGIGCDETFPQRFAALNALMDMFMIDPVGAYVSLKRYIRNQNIAANECEDEKCKKCTNWYVFNVLNKIRELFEKTSIIQEVRNTVDGHTIGDREIYRNIFAYSLRPNFTFTAIMAAFPRDGKLIDHYLLPENTEVRIFRVPNSIRYLYHVLSPELRLSADEHVVLDFTRNVMSTHQPKLQQFKDQIKMREVFKEIAQDLIKEYCVRKNLDLGGASITKLSEILARETAGYGILEIILADPNVQDVMVNAPPGETPLRITHADYEDCDTNILPSVEEVEAWASRLKLYSGRPLDQANPVLDTSLDLSFARARVAAVTNSLSPHGLAFAFRRHRDKPWTIPLFLYNKMINELGAGLLSYMIDGSRTMLFAGTRSAGKTSLLSACMVEILRKYRMITVEDTMELPVDHLRKLGFDVLSLKVRSAITKVESELTAAEGIRTALRLGDSCLILGEVRSGEAKALYEAMRVGALANVVAGTIHGESPYGVFDRVVHDLGVPATSFKATDVITICNAIKTPDGLHKFRRVVKITEVRKRWQKDPIEEDGFMDLMVYNPKTDQLEPTQDFLDGKSEVIRNVAESVKGWDKFSDILAEIKLRGKVKQAIVDYAVKHKLPEFMEAKFVVNANDQFHIISEAVAEDHGSLVPGEIFKRWDLWMKEQVREALRRR